MYWLRFSPAPPWQLDDLQPAAPTKRAPSSCTVAALRGRRGSELQRQHAENRAQQHDGGAYANIAAATRQFSDATAAILEHALTAARRCEMASLRQRCA